MRDPALMVLSKEDHVIVCGDLEVLRDPVIEPQKGRRKGRVQIPGRLPVDC